MGSSSENIVSVYDHADLYRQLWSGCAGPTAKVPRVGDRVFYFPHGHLEQLVACMNEAVDNDMWLYDVPAKILCKVVDVQLKAVPGTEEVYAGVTLIPDNDISEESSVRTVPEKVPASSFSKVLTASDVSIHGICGLPKQHAEETFPPLDTSQAPVFQDLVAKDIHGNTWELRHSYSGTPRRHVLACGWNKFSNMKRLAQGDTCIFMRGLGKNELYIGVRRAVREQKLPSDLTCVNMQHGILSNAQLAIKARTPLTVYYYPQTRAAPFIVAYDEVLQSSNVNYTLGLRCEMFYDGGGHVLQKFTGRIIGKQDIDPSNWHQSEWRCLQVCWDAPAYEDNVPERVSPWSIQILGFALPPQQPSVSLDQHRLAIFRPIIHDFTSPRTYGIRDVSELTLEIGSSSRQEDTDMTELTLELGSSSRQEDTDVTELTLQIGGSSCEEETKLEEVNKSGHN